MFKSLAGNIINGERYLKYLKRNNLTGIGYRDLEFFEYELNKLKIKN